MQVNIIHLPARTDRWQTLLSELSTQKISDYRIWDGVIDPITPFRGISKAHKQIVQFAKDDDLPEILIGEDDLHFTAPGAFTYFLNSKPADYDIYLGSIYHGNLKDDNSVDFFSGLTFYIINKKFYEKFLSSSEENHLDQELKDKGKFVVCDPFAVIQHNGFSDNMKQYCNYDHYLKGRKLFGTPTEN